MKFLITKIISVLTILALCVSLTACKTHEDKCAGGHSWKLTSTTATCLSGGVENYECEVCKTTKTENVSAYGHDLVQSSYTAPTCKTTGEEVKKCSRCGFESKNTLLTIDHDYQVKSTTPSTCTVKGSKLFECSMCHETKTEALELKNHDYKLVNTINSTCITHGSKQYKCNDCTDTYSEELPFAEHTYETEIREATCFTHGGTFEKCSVCGDEKPVDETPLLAHDFGADGYCTKCGIFETLFDEEKLNVKFIKTTALGSIQGDLFPKFNNTLKSIPDSYWLTHIVTLTLSLYDKNGQLLEAHSFISTTIPHEGANYGKLTLQYVRVNGEIGDFMVNQFLIFPNEGNKYSPDSRQNCKSFKIELSCEGYKTIEKTYYITEAQ